VEGERIQRLFLNTNFKDDDSVLRFSMALSRMKLDDALREKGCRNGDQVFIEDYSFEFNDEE
ncbi:MAG: Obg family GTPase CgtA, partial [Erysipelotrichaceae bacterium]|nr:Obg family GTPase CgtA [Erysipelotrichaceae bacterium]